MRFQLQIAIVGMLAAAASVPMSASAGALGTKAKPSPASSIDQLTITESGNQFQIAERSARTASDAAAAPMLHLGSAVHLDAALLRPSRQVTGAVE
ncbi:hypothetical protein [Sphingobium olei]|uniref:Uncharacterized protein n=1 Tax=Sphingobium olei TaxID=420955 RepID=A0ABW3NVS6_9SPHN